MRPDDTRTGMLKLNAQVDNLMGRSMRPDRLEIGRRRLLVAVDNLMGRSTRPDRTRQGHGVEPILVSPERTQAPYVRCDWCHRDTHAGDLPIVPGRHVVCDYCGSELRVSAVEQVEYLTAVVVRLGRDVTGNDDDLTPVDSPEGATRQARRKES